MTEISQGFVAAVQLDQALQSELYQMAKEIATRFRDPSDISGSNHSKILGLSAMLPAYEVEIRVAEGASLTEQRQALADFLNTLPSNLLEFRERADTYFPEHDAERIRKALHDDAIDHFRDYIKAAAKGATMQFEPGKFYAVSGITQLANMKTSAAWARKLVRGSPPTLDSN